MQIPSVDSAEPQESGSDLSPAERVGRGARPGDDPPHSFVASDTTREPGVLVDARRVHRAGGACTRPTGSSRIPSPSSGCGTISSKDSVAGSSAWIRRTRAAPIAAHEGDWQRFWNRWEYLHVLRAVLAGASFVFLVIAVGRVTRAVPHEQSIPLSEDLVEPEDNVWGSGTSLKAGDVGSACDYARLRPHVTRYCRSSGARSQRSCLGLRWSSCSSAMNKVPSSPSIS